MHATLKSLKNTNTCSESNESVDKNSKNQPEFFQLVYIPYDSVLVSGTIDDCLSTMYFTEQSP